MIKNILITSAGRRVSLVKSFQKTLKRFNEEGKVFTTDMQPLLSSACQISDGFFEVPRVTDKKYPALLKRYCRDHDISIVIPTIDTELHILASLKEEFAKEGITIAVSSFEICQTFYLKASTEAFFVQHGFDTPRSVDDLQNCRYPLFAKLNNSSCSVGAQIVETQEIAQKLRRDPNYVFQEFIEGDEYTVDVFVDSKGHVVSIVPRKRLEVRAGEVSKAKTCKDPQIIDAVKSLCETLEGAYGCITVQLFKTEDRIVFIEINPRFGGGYPLSYLAGANFAEYLIQDFLGEELSYSQEWRDDLIMLRYDAEVLVDGSSL